MRGWLAGLVGVAAIALAVPGRAETISTSDNATRPLAAAVVRVAEDCQVAAWEETPVAAENRPIATCWDSSVVPASAGAMGEVAACTAVVPLSADDEAGVLFCPAVLPETNASPLPALEPPGGASQGVPLYATAGDDGAITALGLLGGGAMLLALYAGRRLSRRA